MLYLCLFSLLLLLFFLPEALQFFNHAPRLHYVVALNLSGKRVNFVDKLLDKLVEVLVESTDLALGILGKSF